MKFSFNFKKEPSYQAWFWRFLLGPCMLLDGVVFTLSCSTVSTGSTYEVSRRLAMARILGMKPR